MLIRQSALALAFALLAACATLYNSGRPRYTGPIAKLAWHDAGLRISERPVIANGVVYALGRPWDTSRAQLFAFDAATGRCLWTRKFSSAKLLLVAGPDVFVADATSSARHRFADRHLRDRQPSPSNRATVTSPASGKTPVCGPGTLPNSSSPGYLLAAAQCFTPSTAWR